MKEIFESLAREYQRLFADHAWIVWCGIGGAAAVFAYALVRALVGRPGVGIDRTGISELIGIPYIDGLIVLIALFSVVLFFVPRALPRGLSLLVLVLVPFALAIIVGVRAA